MVVGLVLAFMFLATTAAYAQSSAQDPEAVQYGSPTAQVSSGGGGGLEASGPGSAITGLLPETGGSSLMFLVVIVALALIGTGTLRMIRRRSDVIS